MKNRPWSYMRHRGVCLGLIHPGPSLPRPQMMVKDATVNGGWRPLLYGVMS